MAVAYHALGRQEEAETMIDKIDELDDQYETLAFTQVYALQGAGNVLPVSSQRQSEPPAIIFTPVPGAI